MNTIIRAGLLALIAASHAHSREFTMADGSKVSGDITGIANGIVQIATQDGKKAAVPVASMTQTDKDFARQWWEENRKYSFSITSLKKKGSGRSKGRTGSVNTVTQDWLFSVTVRNNTNAATPPLSLAYDLFVSEPGVAPRSEARNTINIPALKAGGTHSFDTVSVEVSSYEAPKGMFFTNGQDRKKRDSLEGLTARISANGRLIWIHESSAGLLTGKTLTFGSVTITTSGSKGNPPYSGPPDGLASALLR